MRVLFVVSLLALAGCEPVLVEDRGGAEETGRRPEARRELPMEHVFSGYRSTDTMTGLDIYRHKATGCEFLTSDLGESIILIPGTCRADE